MSDNRYGLELTEHALSDLIDILAFTHRTWGERQRQEYKHKIDEAFQTIAANPHAGQQRHGLMVYSAGRSRIFYDIRDNLVIVIRILHDRMDAARHLP